MTTEPTEQRGKKVSAMLDTCLKAQSGKHEIDFENIRYERHAGHEVAVYVVYCRHCGARGEIAMDARECDWDES